MVGEQEKKEAFRAAYNYLSSVSEPKNTEDYYAQLIVLANHTMDSCKGNRLLPFLLSGIYEYLSEEARGRGNKE